MLLITIKEIVRGNLLERKLRENLKRQLKKDYPRKGRV
jgi:hypothetical protein